MTYEPMASKHQEFKPFNHFEDDILRFYYQYKIRDREYLYRPYWEPHSFGGTPQYAVTYATHFSSTNWVLKFFSLERAFHAQMFLQLLVAGMGMYFLLTSLGIGAAASIFFGGVYMFNSMFTTFLLRSWMVGPYSWFPFLVAFFLRVLQKPRAQDFLLSSLFLALTFTDGFLQSDGAIFIVLLALALLRWWETRDLKTFRKIFILSFGIYLFAFALSAVMWLPTLEYLRADLGQGHSRVAGVDYGKSLFQRICSIPMLVGFVVPDLLGSVRTLDLTKFARTHLQDFTAFIGVVPLILSLCALRLRKTLSPKAKYFLILSALGLFLPIFTPLDRFLYFRFFIVYILGACVLGAWVLNKWMDGSRPVLEEVDKWVKRIGLFLLVVFGGVASLTVVVLWKGAWLSEKMKGQILAQPSQGYFGSRFPNWLLARVDHFIDAMTFSKQGFIWPVMASFGVFVFGYWLWKKRKISPQMMLVIVSIVTLFELGRFNYNWLPRNDLKEHPLYPESELTSFLRDRTLNYRAIFANPTKDPSKMLSLTTNIPQAYGIFALDGFDGLVVPTVASKVREFDNYEILGRFNVKYVALPSDVVPDAKALHQILRVGRVTLYENSWALPRGQVVTHLEGSEKPQQSVKVLKSDGVGTTYSVQTKHSGYFVVSESYYPGWKAFVDGIEKPVLRVHDVMRAVQVEEGTHRVEFLFAPKSYAIGLWITGFAIIFWIGAMTSCIFRGPSLRGAGPK
jgi:hypothetical protein